MINNFRENIDYLYHGSYKNGLDEILPFATKGNAYNEKVACFTPFSNIAILYIRKTLYHWITFDIDDDSKIVKFVEVFPNMLEEMYSDISGTIYCVKKDNPLIKQSRFKNVFISDAAIKVDKAIYIDNLYSEILRLEQERKIIIKKYASLNEKELMENEGKVFDAIVFERLIINPWEKSEFVRRHFPNIWAKATEMYQNKSHEEIRQQILDNRKK